MNATMSMNSSIHTDAPFMLELKTWGETSSKNTN